MSSETPTQFSDVIRLQNLTYCYDDGTVALNGISFSITEGETVAIVGPNGAGKTTLVLHLNGILPQSRLSWWSGLIHGHGHGTGSSNSPKNRQRQGSIWVDGIELREETLLEIRKRVGLLFQDPDDQLFAMTVIEDVAFGPMNHGMDKTSAYAWARECLREVGLEALADRSPGHLSFGERKRVCLAGVLACRPSILVMDEPTANLDPRSRRRFIELTTRLKMTKMIVTHDLDMVVEICDRVLLMDQGLIVASGQPRELLSDSTLIEKHGLEVPLSLLLR